MVHNNSLHPELLRSGVLPLITLTQIGYGDVVPITPLGKIFASVVAICSIAMIAVPTGIIAAAFSDGMQRHRNLVEAARHGHEHHHE